MSVPRTKPTFIAGTPRSSGDVQTGQIQWTYGGGRTYSQISGLIGGDVTIYSGACRLDQILVINPPSQSGAATIFYDAAVATSGGPFIASGHKVVGVIPNAVDSQSAIYNSGAAVNPNSRPGVVLTCGMAVQSGLCVAVVRSGGAGFTVGFTPEATSFEAPGTSLGA